MEKCSDTYHKRHGVIKWGTTPTVYDKINEPQLPYLRTAIHMYNANRPRCMKSPIVMGAFWPMYMYMYTANTNACTSCTYLYEQQIHSVL